MAMSYDSNDAASGSTYGNGKCENRKCGHVRLLVSTLWMSNGEGPHHLSTAK